MKVYNQNSTKVNILRKNAQKIKKHDILHFMTTFHNFAFEIETSFKFQRCHEN